MWRTTPSPNADQMLTKRLTLNSTAPPGAIELHQSFASSAKSSLTVTWSELCSEARRVFDPQGFTTADQISTEAVPLLAAIRVGNEKLAAALEREKWVADFRHKDTGNLDMEQLVLAGLKGTVAAGQEDLACGMLEMLPCSLPLFLVHRAGERCLVRFLATLLRLKVPIDTNRVIATIPQKVKRLLHRRATSKLQRFPAKSRYMTQEEVLRWAVVTEGREGVEKVLGSQLFIDTETLSRVLLSEGLSDLLCEILPQAELMNVPLELLLQAGQLRLAAEVLEQQKLPFSRKTPELLKPYQTIFRLITEVRDPRSSLSALYLLSLVRKAEWNLPEVELAYETLSMLLFTDSVEQVVMANHCNPLLLCVALSELSMQVSDFSLQLRDRFLMLSSDFLRLAELIQSQFRDYRRLKELYLEKAYGPHCLFDVITANTERYRVLLKSDTVAALVQDLWTGGEAVGFNFDFMSATNCYLDSPHSGLFDAHRLFARCPGVKCVLQLHYWRTNGSLRFFVETVMLLVLYGILLSQMQIYCSIIGVLENPMEHMSEVPDAIKQVTVQLNLNCFITANTGALALNVFQQFAYKHLRKEPFVFSFTDALAFFLFFFAFVVTYCSTDEMMKTIPLDTNISFQEPIYAMLMFAISLRICSVLLQTRTFGPWIRMIFVIVKDILVFLVLYILAVLSFSTSYVYLFRRDGDYFGNIQRSIRTLFQWSVGGVDATIFTSRVELGSILAIVWGFVSTIILLNLLIAVLSSRFDELSPQVTADYVSIMYRSYSQTHYEPPYGALIIAPAPFNIFTLPLVPLYIAIPASARKLDDIFVLMSYQGLFLFGSLMFLLYNFLLSGFVYVYVAVRVAGRANCRSLLSLVKWIVGGPPYLLYLTGVSYVRFARQMYQVVPQAEASLSEDVLLSVKRFLAEVCKDVHSPVTLPLSDIKSVVTRFPFLKTTANLQPSQARMSEFRQAAERVYFSKSQLLHSRSRCVLEFFEQFCSHSDAEVSVNLTRMDFFVRHYEKNPQKLAAVNIRYVQKALLQLRSETVEK